MHILKKSGLFLMLLLMATVSGFAQDSYREAVKQYLTAVDQFEKSKSLISDMSVLFEKDGQVDNDQLTKRYLDEVYENDMIDWFMGVATARDMTEADLREVASLLSSPEGKTFEIHQQEWMGEALANLLMPFMMLMDEDEDVEEDTGMAEDKDWSHGGLLDLLGPPIQPNADIDAAYAAKFKDVILESDFGKVMMDEMTKRFDEDPNADPKEQESSKMFKDWMTASVPAVLLNSAYGTITLEDLDYAAMLYSNEPYCKYNSYGSSANFDDLKIGHFLVKYIDWMKQQGATVTEDPERAMEFFKSMLNLSFDDINLDEP